MRLTYLGHSCFLIQTPQARLLLDPYLTGNPLASCRAEDIECDYILCSHGHDDHICDAAAISRRCKAPIICNYEVCEYLNSKGLQTAALNPGGAADFPFGRVKFTIAHHSSSHIEADGKITYLGQPGGLLIHADGKSLYHAGDTALFLDMQLIGRGGLDAALIPIGDRFTMGPEDALEALDLLRPKVAVPMHYNTWEPIRQDPLKFAAAAAARGHSVNPLKPGASLEL
jgi:L-ascorbate metabolism protein UlaG (beta-lactamase superfamily)